MHTLFYYLLSEHDMANIRNLSEVKPKNDHQIVLKGLDLMVTPS